MLTKLDLMQFKKYGYIIKDILTENEISTFLNKLQIIMDKWPNQTDMMNIQFLQPSTCIKDIQSIIHHNKIMEACKYLLNGGEIILDGASLFYAKTCVSYMQGWHRDVIQIPDNEISESWYSKDHFHNNIQINIPLIKDDCLWVVDCSHTRQFNAEELTIFKGSKKIAPVDGKVLQNGKRLILKPGQAVFYNNLLIHRGYAPVLKKDRITIQLGYHSNITKPTYHFGVLNHNEYTSEYLKYLDYEVVEILNKHIQEKKRYPEISKYYNMHQGFIKKEFNINYN
jgi:hypothetical protein